MKFLVAIAAVAASLASPGIYWHASPVSAGQAVFVAGSFGNSSAPTVKLCASPSCSSSSPLSTLEASDGSVVFDYPATCASAAAPGCTFQVCGADGSCTTLADPNVPDVWFTMSYPPLNGTTFNPIPVPASGVVTVNSPATGLSILRIFGRSLAFSSSSGSLMCVPASQRSDAPQTTLQLTPGGAAMPAVNATCYEAAFDLTDTLSQQGSYSAVLSTQFGSVPLSIVVAAAPAPASLTVIDVDAQAGGNVTAALAMAAAASGDAIVVLGPHDYQFTQSITVPDSTAVVGSPSGGSRLIFTLNETGNAASTGAIAGGSHWMLRDFTMLLTQAPKGTPAVLMPRLATNFTVLRMNVTMVQNNVSNAFRIQGSVFQITDSFIQQAGICLWPPTSAQTSFLESVTILFENATSGYFARNTLLWHCSAFDMDVSSRIVWEDNTINCTDGGIIPHGNSMSAYDYGDVPFSQSFAYSHNKQSRPANNNPTDWAFHESLTTDAPGGWGAGLLGSINGNTITVPTGLVNASSGTNGVGATAVIIAGPGAGQWRQITARPSATTLVLASPLDEHAVIGQSRIAVVASIGGKLVTDNSFTWGSVVQIFGTTLTTVFADNRLDHQNNAGADSGAIDGSMTGFGLCYGNEPQPMFFSEYTGNTLVDSNGISLHDVPNAQCADTWPGPYIRWSVIRNNSISGIAPCNPGVCGSVNATNPATSDLLVERNSFSCPPSALLPGNGLNVLAANSVVRA